MSPSTRTCLSVGGAVALFSLAFAGPASALNDLPVSREARCGRQMDSCFHECGHKGGGEDAVQKCTGHCTQLYTLCLVSRKTKPGVTHDIPKAGVKR